MPAREVLTWVKFRSAFLSRPQFGLFSRTAYVFVVRMLNTCDCVHRAPVRWTYVEQTQHWKSCNYTLRVSLRTGSWGAGSWRRWERERELAQIQCDLEYPPPFEVKIVKSKIHFQMYVGSSGKFASCVPTIYWIISIVIANFVCKVFLADKWGHRMPGIKFLPMHLIHKSVRLIRVCKGFYI